MLFSLSLASALLTLAPQASAEKAGYWLSVDLIGPAAARSEAAFSMSADTAPRSPRDGRLPGQAVGHVPDIHAVLAWLELHAFGTATPALPFDPAMLHQTAAPGVAGSLREAFGVQLRAVVVTGATASGDRRTIEWPTDATRIMPPATNWHVAALLPDAAPLFAAPAVRVPPASERFTLARRRGDVFVVGMVDRCERVPQRQCTRWVQAVIRDGDRFVPGYLPAAQVALRDRWVSSTPENLPRAQLLRVGVRGENAQFLLVARDAAGVLHRRMLDAPLQQGTAGLGFPDLTLSVSATQATLTQGGQTQVFELDATLDARHAPGETG
ncbi:MAG: hypothetical protein KUG77_00350 [Nannocystaceae bacterium]|nr:hypothetical protein [Nannocystaceae bacterium]